MEPAISIDSRAAKSIYQVMEKMADKCKKLLKKIMFVRNLDQIRKVVGTAKR